MVRKQWFDRKFEFDHLNGTIDGILERLNYTGLRLEHKMNSIDPDILELKPGDKWSIKEQVGHLIDLEPLWRGRVLDMINNLEEMREADLENHKTHEANHNSRSMDDLIGEFSEARKSFVMEISNVKDQAESLTALHPRLKKPMRLIDLAYFVAEHDDHHLASISLLAEELKSS